MVWLPTHRWVAAFAAVACLSWPATASGHDLPADVVVHVFVKPSGSRMTVLVRVPMSAMGDVEYPTGGAAGQMDLAAVEPALRAASALWLEPALQLYEHDRPLGAPSLRSIRVSLPSDRAFSSFDEALAHIHGSPLPPDMPLAWNQAVLDAEYGFDITADSSPFAIDVQFARLAVRVLTAVRFVMPGGAVRAFEFAGDAGRVDLDPRWDRAALRFVRLGFTHILGGVDHLLFLLCLIVPVRRVAALVPVVTAFAVAHSLTLIGSAFGVVPDALWFAPLVEVLIAASVVYMALENILARRFQHRWAVAFAFGLVHGFGFSLALRESLQFAGTHLLTSLLAFNAGVELGQLLVLLAVVPPLTLLFRVTASERVTTAVLSAVIGHHAWHWMTDRVATLRQFPFAWPVLDAAFAVTALGWALLAVAASAAVWGLSALTRAWSAKASREASKA